MTSLFDNVDIVKKGKNFRILSKTTLQLSIFYRKRQIYLLKDVNRCSYTFTNSVGVCNTIWKTGVVEDTRKSELG